MTEFTLTALSGGKDAIVAAMLDHPAVAGGDVAQGMKAAVAVTEQLVHDAIKPGVEAALTECYDTHVMLYGDLDEAGDDNADEWQEALDASVDEALQPWAHVLSAQWLSDKCVQVPLADEDGISTLASQTGFEVFKQLKGKKTPNQVLSEVGIVKADVEQALGAAEPVDGTSIAEQVKEVFEKAIEGIRLIDEVPDRDTLKDEIDLLTGKDDILAAGAANRLGGLDTNDIEIVRAARRVLGLGGPETLTTIFETLANPPTKAKDMPDIPAMFDKRSKKGGKGKGKGKGKAAKPPAPPAPEGAPEAAPEPTGGVPTEALQLLKAHANVKDADVAEEIGMSRAGFNNKVNGKGEPITDPDQVLALRGIIEQHVEGLQRALELLDEAV